MWVVEPLASGCEGVGGIDVGVHRVCIGGEEVGIRRQIF